MFINEVMKLNNTQGLARCKKVKSNIHRNTCFLLSQMLLNRLKSCLKVRDASTIEQIYVEFLPWSFDFKLVL